MRHAIVAVFLHRWYSLVHRYHLVDIEKNEKIKLSMYVGVAMHTHPTGAATYVALC